MVQGRQKSRTFARKNVRTAKETKVRYDKRSPSPHVCPETGQKLHGVPRGRPSDIRSMTKSARRPSRPYGGQLSSKAMRKKFKAKARNLDL